MPDNQDPKTQDPPKEPTPEEAEEAFWSKFDARLNNWFDNKVKEYRGTSAARTGRSTLPGIMADIVFGAKKD